LRLLRILLWLLRILCGGHLLPRLRLLRRHLLLLLSSCPRLQGERHPCSRLLLLLRLLRQRLRLSLRRRLLRLLLHHLLLRLRRLLRQRVLLLRETARAAGDNNLQTLAAREPRAISRLEARIPRLRPRSQLLRRGRPAEYRTARVGGDRRRDTAARRARD
jgi:hypothetical protein